MSFIFAIVSPWVLCLSFIFPASLAYAQLAPPLRPGSGLESTEAGRDWLKYIVRCAMPAGTSIDVSHSGEPQRAEGAFGLAPEWAHTALDATGKRWVSACVLGFVNALGVHVLVSMRGDNANLRATVTDAERHDFDFQEAAFYGDIFATPPIAYVCRGRGGPPSPSREQRVCSDPSEHAGVSRCAMIITGDCTAICATEDSRDHAYRGCRGGDRTYGEVVTVFLPSAAK